MKRKKLRGVESPFFNMKRLIFVLALLWSTAQAQTIGYLRYDTVKIYTTKVGGRGSLDVTGNVKFTGLLPKSAGTDSVIVRDASGNLGTTAKSAFGGAGWELLGNAGTTAGTNFIGTTDGQDLVFKRNSTEGARVLHRELEVKNLYLGGVAAFTDDSTGIIYKWHEGFSVKRTFIFMYKHPNVAGDNLFFGLGAGNRTMGSTGTGNEASYNTGIGTDVLRFNTIGQRNTGVGTYVLDQNTTGFNNTGAGQNSLGNNTSGYGNTAYGVRALGNNVIGVQNVAVGVDALFTNTADYNVGVGLDAFYLNTTGSRGVAVGDCTLVFNTTGSRNVGMGFRAGHDHLTGSYNTYIGDSTGQGNVSGDNNTIIGARVSGLASGLTKNIILADGEGNQRLRFNNNGALSFDGGSSFGTANFVLQTNGSGSPPTWAAAAGGSGITVGTTTITSGTSGRFGYNNAGVYGETNGMDWNATDRYMKMTSAAGGSGFLQSLNVASSDLTAYFANGYYDASVVFNQPNTGRSTWGFILDNRAGIDRFAINYWSPGPGAATVPFIVSTTGSISNTGSDPTAGLHLKAGTASANTAPLKFTTGTLNTTAEVGAMEYNGTHYLTKASGLRYATEGTIADFYTDVNNGTTVETDIYTYTTPASTLANDGEKIFFTYTLNLTDITSTATIKVYMAGDVVANTGALTVSATGAIIVNGWVVRTSSTTARVSVNINSPTASTAVYTSQTDLTGEDWTTTNIIKITAQAGGGTPTSGDIIGKSGSVSWRGKANN